jgi:hypothetical protein
MGSCEGLGEGLGDGEGAGLGVGGRGALLGVGTSTGGDGRSVGEGETKLEQAGRVVSNVAHGSCPHIPEPVPLLQRHAKGRHNLHSIDTRRRAAR